MRRFFYRALIALHPPRFRERFGDEMMCVFDEAGGEHTARLFADGAVSLARQWLLRSNLWKMAAGAVISSSLLLLCGYSVAGAVDRWLVLGRDWHERLMMNPWLGEHPAPFDEVEFSREAAQAVTILGEIRKTEAQKQRSRRHRAPHAAPNLSSSARTNKG
ncbi:MAG: hypothetical protein WA581_03325 [Candidatus Acidiferrales bacterium]